MQDLALGVTLVLTGLLVAAFAFVIRRATVQAPYDVVAERGYSVRNTFFKVLLGLGLLIVIVSLPRAFTAIAKPANSHTVQTVNAVGYQWYWEIDRDEVEAGIPVEFLVSSADVTHGFGLYDEDLNLVSQTQVMPGYTNRLNVTFDRPGTYRIMCLEYCGLAHHDMIAEITVTAPHAPNTDTEGAAE